MRGRFFDDPLRPGGRGEAASRLVFRKQSAKTRIGNGHPASADQMGMDILARFAGIQHLVNFLYGLGKFFPARGERGTAIGIVVCHCRNSLLVLVVTFRVGRAYT